MTCLHVDQIQVIGAYDRGGIGIDAGATFPLDEAF